MYENEKLILDNCFIMIENNIVIARVIMFDDEFIGFIH